MRKGRTFAYICLFILFSIPFWGTHRNMAFSQNLPQSNNLSTDSIISASKDSILLPTDSLAIRDSIPAKKPPLEAIVDYKSNDSLIMTQGNWAYLFGSAEVNYEPIKLTGEIISINMDSSVVEAKYALDSIGEEFGYPIFSDGGSDYETKTMRYNFKTKKGFSQHLVTEQGEGYVVAVNTKMNEDKSFFMKEGKYTTCDQHDHPHFYLALTKAKCSRRKM